MQKMIEQLMKKREPVDPKCQGKGFATEEKVFLSKEKPYCSKIEPVMAYEIDESTGEVIGDVGKKETIMAKWCRCSAYVNPSSWWRRGGCPLADHYKPYQNAKAFKIRVGQQKQKK